MLKKKKYLSYFNKEVMEVNFVILRNLIIYSIYIYTEGKVIITEIMNISITNWLI